MKVVQVNTYFFDQCKKKLEMYLKTGKQLISKRWECLLAYRNGDDIQFYDGCDLIIEISRGSYQRNLETAVIWLLDGQKDPLKVARGEE